MKIQHAKNTFRRQGMFYNSSSLFVNWYNKWIGCIIIMSFKSGASVTKWPRWHCFKSCILTLIPRPLHWAATWHVLIASGMGCFCRYQSSWQNWPWLPWAAVLDKTQFQVCSDWRFPEFFKGGKSSKPLPFWITILTKLSQLQWCPDGNFMMTSKDLWHQTTFDFHRKLEHTLCTACQSWSGSDSKHKYLCQWAPAACPGFLRFPYGPVGA